MKKAVPFNKIITVLTQLHKDYPQHNLGRHLSHAFADYGDLWGVSDKELLFALEKYTTQLEIDPIATDEDVQKILEDTDKIFNSGFDPYDESDTEEDY